MPTGSNIDTYSIPKVITCVLYYYKIKYEIKIFFSIGPLKYALDLPITKGWTTLLKVIMLQSLLVLKMPMLYHLNGKYQLTL